MSLTTIPSFNYDSYFLPLLSDKEVENARQMMTKSEFKEWMVKENKKGKFNLKLSKYAQVRDTKRKLLQSHNREIVVFNDVITEFKNKQLTFTGTVKEIQTQVFDFQRQITEFQKSKGNLEEEAINIRREFNKEKKEFDRISFIVSMELDLYDFNYERKRQEKKDAADPDCKDFLKRLNALPDEILRMVRGYFTCETRAALLAKTYQPIKLFQSLKKNTLKTAIYRIYSKYCTQCCNPVLKKAMIDLWTKFYKDPNISQTPYHSASLNDMKLMIEYLFHLFYKFDCPIYCFELYRMIIVMKHKKF